jgi:hypothetical protein
MTCDVNVQTLGDIPVALPPYGCGEGAFHGFIVS